MLIVFQDKAKADTLLNEIAVTPFGMVWCWYDPDMETNQIQYVYSSDGRCVVCHNFSEEDRAWLEIYLDGIIGVQITDSLPSDWRVINGE